MKVLVCTTVPLQEASAGRNRLLRMASALDPLGIEAILVGTGTPEGGAEWEEQMVAGRRGIAYDPRRTGARRYCRAMTNGAQGASFYKKFLPEIARSYRCAGAISYAYQGQSGEAILLGARIAGIFVVADMVEWFDWSPYRIANGMNYEQWRLREKVLPHMDGVVGISRAWVEWARGRGIPAVWIPSFAEERPWRGDARRAGSQFTLVFMGHWVDREKPLVLLAALRRCVVEGLDVRLRVLGRVGETGRERRVREVVRRDRVLRERVDFVGFVSDEERDRELANAGAFVLLRGPGRETDMQFPTRLPEYLLSGNPVVLSRVAGFGECFSHKKDIWFVSERNDPREVAAAIKELAVKEDLRLRIGAAGRRTAVRLFSLGLLGRRLGTFLEEAAERATRNYGRG